MPATKAKIGLGGQFFIGTGEPAVFTTSMTEVSTIDFSDFTVNEVDATHLLSPDATEETIPGLLKPGAIQITANYIGDEMQLSVNDLAQANTTFPWKITTPVGEGTLTILGRGFITSQKVGPITPQGKTEFRFSVKAAGAVAYSVAP
jgi:hypothetical protein